MQLQNILAALERIAPLSGAEAWDNVGLLLGDPNVDVTCVLMAIDATPAVLAEAQTCGAQLLVAYHPPLFKAVKRVHVDSPLFVAARANLALFSPHTALDAAQGGTNDVLADAVGLGPRAPLLRQTIRAQALKLVVFVPKAHADALLEALFAAGAGRIGAYARCSYRTSGEGSFCPDTGAQPAVGRPGEQTSVAEERLELLVPKRAVGAIIAALMAHHPYETPAFDLIALADTPAQGGQGRIGTLPDDQACRLSALAARVRGAMGAGHVMVAKPAHASDDKQVRRIAVQAGAGDSMLGEVVSQGAEVFVTGEMRHHTVLAALAQGVSVITLTHDDSERAALAPYAQALRAQAPGLNVLLSVKDRSPWLN